MPSEQMTTEIEGAIDDIIATEAKDREGDAGLVDAARKANDATQTESGTTESSRDSHITAAASEPAPAPAESPPQRAPISDDLLARAADVGIHVADAKHLTPRFLESIIARREEAAQELTDDETPVDADDLQKDLDKAADPFADLPKLDPEIHDPDVIKMFDKLNEISRGQRSELQDLQKGKLEADEVVAAREEADSEVATREGEQFFDGQVKGLGEGFTEALGVGGYGSLDRGSSQSATREAIMEQMSVLLSGYQATGQTLPSREEIFDTAARIVLPSVYQGVHDRKIAGTQSGQHLQQSSSGEGSTTKTAEEDAASAVDELLDSRQ